MNILELAILKKMVGGGGGSGTDNYNDLSNLPKINDTTLSGNKTSANLGLQSEINSDSKLASDLVDDTDQDNKFVTTTEKNTWNGKQNAIDSDHKLSSDLVDDANKTNKFVTSTEKNTWNAKQNAIDSDHKLSSDLVDDANKTNKFVTSTEKNTWNAKQNAIDADHKLSSSLVSFTTAEAAALASGIDSSKVAQISTNQSNILYALNTGVKNELVIEELQATSYVQGVTFTWNDDQSITVNAPSTHGAVWIYINQEHRADMITKFKNRAMVISGMPANSPVELSVWHYDGTHTAVGDGTSNGEFTLTVNDPELFAIQIYVPQNVAASNVVIKPMICTKEAWNQSHDYMLPALPNYDLTRLQAEDRAALAEEIDAGAKQLANFTSTTNLIVNSNGYTIAVSGKPSSTANQWIWQGQVSKSGYYAFVVEGTSIPTTVLYNATDDTNVLLYNTSSGGKSIGYLSTGKTYKIGAYLNSSTTYNTSFNCMLCTKAAFGVSPKFVPYRMSYQDLCDKKDAALSTTSKTSGSLDDIAENSFYFVSDGTTGRPVSEYGFVKTSVYSSSVMLQEFTSFSGNAANSGLVFVRVKQAGTWQSWKQLTNA